MEHGAILLLAERPGPDIDALVESLKADGLAAVYAITAGGLAAAAGGLQAVYAQEQGCRSIVLVDTRHGYQAKDILAFARAVQAHSDSLVIAERPPAAEPSFLARLADGLSHRLVQFFLGIPVNDLRSGLLALPARAVPSLANRNTPGGAEFELELILAGKRGGFPIHSYFLHPGVARQTGKPGQAAARLVLNSMSLSLVLARYVSTSLLTAVVDNLVFLLCYPLVHNVLLSIYVGRLVAILVNYFLLRKVVFNSSDKTTRTFPKYIALVLCSGLLAALLIDFLHAEFNLGVVLGKLVAELLLYLVNFAILNKIVFVHRQPLD